MNVTRGFVKTNGQTGNDSDGAIGGGHSGEKITVRPIASDVLEVGAVTSDDVEGDDSVQKATEFVGGGFNTTTTHSTTSSNTRKLENEGRDEAVSEGNATELVL